MTNKAQNRASLKQMLVLSLLVAISVILERFLGYNDKVLSVSLSFVPIALAGMLYGVIPAVAVSALADVIGALLFPSGPFDIRFTLIAALKGAIYGYFMYKPANTKMRAVLAQGLVTVICHLVLNTLVISTIINRGYFALLPLRLFKNLLLFPLEVLILYKLGEYRMTFEQMTK